MTLKSYRNLLLSNLFDLDCIRDKRSTLALDKYRGLTGLCKRLHTDQEKGISTDTRDRRIDCYGSNIPIVKEATTFLEFVWECFEDLTLKILIGAAGISLIVGTIESPADG